MPDLLPSKKDMGFEDKDDESLAETISHDYSMDNSVNAKRRIQERRGHALKLIVFMAFAALAVAAFCLSIHGEFTLFAWKDSYVA